MGEKEISNIPELLEHVEHATPKRPRRPLFFRLRQLIHPVDEPSLIGTIHPDDNEFSRLQEQQQIEDEFRRDLGLPPEHVADGEAAIEGFLDEVTAIMTAEPTRRDN